MSEFLFAYGTLQPGLAPPEMAAIVDSLQPVGEGSVLGTLYDLGHYPGAVLDSQSAHRIYGKVFQLPQDPSSLRELDAYEEFFPDRPEASQFMRTLCTAHLANGEELACWIYVYNRSVEGAPEIAGGRFERRTSIEPSSRFPL